MKPLVSVIITTYNRAKLMQEAVKSVFAQTYKNFEIIIIDDGSINGTKEVISKIGSDKIRYVYQDNHGYAYAENQGIKQAKGKYIAFLDSDDLFMPNKLRKQVAIMEKNPDVILSHSSYQRINENGVFIKNIHSGRLSGNIYLNTILRCTIGSPTVMMRREKLLETDKFVGNISGDVVLYVGIAKRSKVLGIDEVLSKVRVNKNTTAVAPKNQIIAMHNILKNVVKKDRDMKLDVKAGIISLIYLIIMYQWVRRIFQAGINIVYKYWILSRELLNKILSYAIRRFTAIKNYSVNKLVAFKNLMCKVNKQIRLDIHTIVVEHTMPLNINDFRLARLKNKHKGQRCFIIGNAPSLARTDLTLIKDEITFGVNKIYRTGFIPTYFTISDRLILEQNASEIRSIKNTVKLFPEELKQHTGKDKAIYLHMKSAPLCQPEFSPDALKYIYHGETVTYLCLQLAYYMGIREVYLIGNDWDWGKEYNNMPFGSIVEGGEKTHFAPDYHKSGEKWVTPNIDIGLLVFEKAKQFYETHGSKIYNATKGGKLEVFPRVNYADVAKSYEYNELSFQKKFWKTRLMEHKKKNQEIFGYDWGNPNEIETKDNEGNILGNYLKIKNQYLLPYMKKSSTILELGCGGGKWTQHMLSAGKIICVDLSDEFGNYIKEKLHSDKIVFYRTSGNELAGIKSKSVDFIFSMDTFVRIPRQCVFDYFKEFTRVLKPHGKICVHLPCNDKKYCFDWHFTDLSLDEIKQLCVDNGFKNYEIDKDIITHGVILRVNYGE